MTAYSKIDASKTEDTLSIPIGLVRDLSAARTQAESLNAFAHWSNRIMKAARCSVALPEKDNLVVMGLAGNDAIATGTTMPIKGTFIGQVFESRRADVMTDLENQPLANAQTLAKAGMRTLIIAPLVAGGRCLGTLAFAFATDCGDDRERFEVIKALAQCLATQLLVLDQISELQRLAHTDALTETYNRRYLDSSAPDIWKAWRDRGTAFSIVTVDIDHFKAVNDTHGHAIGDQVLQIVASRMQKCMRQGDDVVRLGGEEFLLALRDATEDLALQVADRVHDVIGGTPISLDNNRLEITISIGVATVSEDDAGLSCVCQRSDSALYAAKAGGRNRICTG